MRIAVTGAAGFLGRRFINSCVKAGHNVLGLDDRPVDLTVVPRPVAWCIEVCDIRNGNRVTKLLERFRPQAIVHLAAMSHIPDCREFPMTAVDINVVGTANILDAAVRVRDVLDEYEAKRFRVVIAGSGEEYDSLSPREYDPLHPRTIYAGTKAACAMLALAWRYQYKMNTITARFSNIYGPGQDAPKFIPLCVQTLLKGDTVELHGNGQHLRDWLYVDDACEAIDCILKKNLYMSFAFNVGGAEHATIANVTTMVQTALLRRNALCGSVKMVDGPVPQPILMDDFSLRNALNCTPRTYLREGIEQVIDYEMKQMQKAA